MATAGGPNIARSGLVFAIDSASPSSISPLGCTGFSGAPQLVKNLITRTDSISSLNDVRLTGVDFYTAVGISYPEGSYGGDIAGRQGITPGYNVRSGSKTYDASRALHLWVWNNDTQAWVADSYFTGLRLNGHCYDNWAGAETGWQSELNKFNSDFNTINNAFPNCTFIVAGSHAAQNYDTPTINNLISLGAPSSTVSSWTNNAAWREFVLVGKPGLGSGNAYGWVFENYPTNSTEVAHLNFRLPVEKITNLQFDGTDDYIDTGKTASQLGIYDADYTCSAWVYPTSLSSDRTMFGTDQTALRQGMHLVFRSGSIYQGHYASDFSAGSVDVNNWYHITYTYVKSSGTATIYKNGVSQGSGTISSFIGTTNILLGRWAGGYNFSGNGASYYIWNRALSSTEVTQNFNAQRSRFGI